MLPRSQLRGRTYSGSWHRRSKSVGVPIPRSIPPAVPCEGQVEVLEIARPEGNSSGHRPAGSGASISLARALALAEDARECFRPGREEVGKWAGEDLGQQPEFRIVDSPQAGLDLRKAAAAEVPAGELQLGGKRIL